MPVISIKSLPLNNPADIPELLKRLNTEIAKAIGYETKHIWSYWQFIESHSYAAGDKTAIRQQNETHSPIISVSSFEGKTQSQIEAILNTIAKVVSEELKISIGNIFITYSEVLSGHVFDGGQVVYKK